MPSTALEGPNATDIGFGDPFLELVERNKANLGGGHAIGRMRKEGLKTIRFAIVCSPLPVFVHTQHRVGRSQRQ